MGNFINSSALVLNDIELSSPRINPKFVDKQNLKQDDNNVLFLEQQESERRLQRLKQMLETKEFKEGKQIQFSPTSASPQQQLKINAFKEQIVIDGKEVSQELIYNLIGKRFHSCLNESSKNLKPYQDLSNKELIHQVCRNERLTFYNYLRFNTINGNDITDETIKDMINREYTIYFKREGEIADIYAKESLQDSLPTMNNLNKRFRFSYQ